MPRSSGIWPHVATDLGVIYLAAPDVPGMGSGVQQHQDGWTLEPQRPRDAYKLPRTAGSNLSCQNLHEGPSWSISVAIQPDNQTAVAYINNMGDSFPPTNRLI